MAQPTLHSDPLGPAPDLVSSNEKLSSYAKYVIDPKNEIRILNLLPAASISDTLHCTLLIVKLEDKPQYEALSYAWGKPIFLERIYLLSGYLAITSNLASALRHLRYTDRPRPLWADAICINQQDDIEKGHQVGLMAQVYQHASCGIVWLGDGDEETRIAFLMIK